ncbi:conserved exported hypothetical protein [Flavobacterium sp. 9AF]|uniref:heavy-metal-associated domain-containing protein n=1 Tax=Flavobacterium sp. 9AF TaxID=2653142 RepID=UPI0012F39785|nr:heavy metal-associated domain-containing protein [Flavobacterium sp. 9AF]VXB41091.1 conserved exported hypothetical protein [Flavobacterium sp. 9AF]
MKNIKLLAIILFSFTVFLSCKKEEATSVEKTSIAPENLATASFTIDGMTCPEGCAKVIENKLVGLEGVSEVKVDFENKTATITYDKQKQTPESLTETVEKVGGGDLYKVSNIKS